MNDINKLKKAFQDIRLFEKAVTHRSWVNENQDADGNNERLEFLGDAVLEFVVSDYLFREFPDKEEGFLTALRANIVNTQNLAVLATKMELGKILRLSRGEEQGNGRENESLLADTVEAVIGAIYIDQGFENAKNFILTNLLSDIDKKLEEPLKDAKSRLQEVVQSKGLSAPRYLVINETGPDHEKEFEIEVIVNSRALGKGTGKSKSRAEQHAAENALVNFEATE